MRDHPIVVYGATGYTGRLICEYLREFNVPFIAAGRDKARIAEALDKVPGIDTVEYEIVEVAHDCGHLVQRLGDPGLVPPGRDERDVELTQVLADQPPGVAGGPVHHDGFAGRHGLIPSAGLCIVAGSPGPPRRTSRVTCPCPRRRAVPRR